MFMRFVYVVTAILLLTGCGGRTLNVNRARNVIAGMPQDALDKQDVDVVKVTQVVGSEAIVETRLKTAFRLERVGDKWIVREVRVGHGQWERVDDLLRALEAVKTEETRKRLDLIADAIVKYQESKGALPAFKDYVSLSDLLSPMFLTPLIRLDAWRHPLAAERVDENTILLQSAGPDGRLGTADDLRKIVRDRTDAKSNGSIR
jgi:hypothetical protein